MIARSRKLSARLWWATLPYAGWIGYSEPGDGSIPAPWYAYPLAWLNKLAARMPGFQAFEPPPEIDCDCDWCRGVPGARFEP